MKVYSILHNDHDIIYQCLAYIRDWQFTGLKKSEVDAKCLDKIVSWLRYLIEQSWHIDGWYRKFLEDNIIELRMQLPKSQYLLRIICGYEMPHIVLLTWYIIKPQEYTDQQTQNSIDQQYIDQISQSKHYRKDFKEQQTLDYSDITNNLFS